MFLRRLSSVALGITMLGCGIVLGQSPTAPSVIASDSNDDSTYFGGAGSSPQNKTIDWITDGNDDRKTASQHQPREPRPFPVESGQLNGEVPAAGQIAPNLKNSILGLFDMGPGAATSIGTPATLSTEGDASAPRRLPATTTESKSRNETPSTNEVAKREVPQALLEPTESQPLLLGTQAPGDASAPAATDRPIHAAMELADRPTDEKTKRNEIVAAFATEAPDANQAEVTQVLNTEVVSEPAAPSQPTSGFLNRPKIIFNPVVTGVDNRGRAVLRPDVQIADDMGMADRPSAVRQAEYVIQDELPAPSNAYAEPEMAYPSSQEWMTPVVVGDCDTCDNGHGAGGWWNGGHGCKNGCGGCASGIGAEYVMHAPFWVDRSEPFNHCYVRADAAADLEFPDRAEYFWAKTPGGKGPVDPGLTDDDPPVSLDRGERTVDYQDIVFYIERGTERISIGTKLPIRSIDPDIRLNTTGFADMEVITRIVLIDGKCWQLSHIFNTHLPTGSVSRGTGNGHVSLEPGVAYRYKFSDLTYFHGDLTYLFPIGADPDHSGQMFNYGIAISHVWIDTDRYAIIPTLELDAWTVLDGRQTLPGFSVNPVTGERFDEIDTVSMLNIYPGVRWVCDKGCDCGVKEFGISSGVCVTEDRWYQEILRLEFRWSR